MSEPTKQFLYGGVGHVKSIEARPCPFCGSIDLEIICGGLGRQVQCQHCHSTGPAVPEMDINGVDMHVYAAVDGWNTRVRRV